MSNEFFVRKGLAIATASVSSSATVGRVLVLGDDSVVRFRTDYITATGSLAGALPLNSVQLSSTTGLTAFGIIDYNRGNISFNRPASLITTSNSFNTLIGASAGPGLTTNANTFVGYRSGQGNQGGCFNTFVGFETGVNNPTTAGHGCNVFVGYKTGNQTVTSGNTFVGACVATDSTPNINNTFIGFEAAKKAGNSVCDTVAIGFKAGTENCVANNVYIGSCAGFYACSGSQNVHIGSCAGVGGNSLHSAQQNVFIGFLAGLCQRNDKNTFVGTCAGLSSDFAESSVFIGHSSGFCTTSGRFNVFVGTCAGWCNQTGCRNVTLGNNAGYGITGCFNVAIGSEAMCATTAASASVAVGYLAGRLSTGNSVTLIGADAGSAGACDGNVFVGARAGFCQLSCNNTFVGTNAGCGAGTGKDNVFVGFNTAVRWGNTQQHTVIGACAGGTTVTQMTGWANTFVGFCAGFNVCGQANTIVGVCAGENLTGEGSTTGINNNMFGYGAGKGVTTGSFNIFIGNNAFSTLGTICNSIVIGQSACATGTGQLVLASSAHPLGTASMGTFSQFLCTVVNGIPLKIPLYF